MVEHKKQHYVPRFYLKRFSSGGKSINLHNLRANRTIYGANLKTQCYRNYFYGKEPDVERALADVEGNTATLFEKIDQSCCLPWPGSPDYFIMVLYILMQHGRTFYSAQATNEMTDKLMKHLMGPQAEAERIDLSRVKIGIEDPAKYSLSIATMGYPLILDMDYKLLLNLSGEQFITSDNPVVFYNHLFSFRWQASNTGIACKGLQIFFPLDPEKLILLYDREVYGVGSASKGVVKITNRRDVYALNTLQMCSASDNVYFRDSDIDIAALHKKAAPFLRNLKANLDVYPQRETAEERREIVKTSWEDIRTNLSFSFVRITRSAKRWRKAFRKMHMQPAVVVRDRRLFDNFEEFLKRVKKKEYEPGDFFRFMEDKDQHDTKAKKVLYQSAIPLRYICAVSLVFSFRSHKTLPIDTRIPTPEGFLYLKVKISIFWKKSKMKNHIGEFTRKD